SRGSAWQLHRAIDRHLPAANRPKGAAMIDRRQFTVAGLWGAVLSALPLAGNADDRTPAIGNRNPADHFEPCARACSDCQRECDFCAAHCADMVGKGEQTFLVTLQ